jgi:hypothetical protein
MEGIEPGMTLGYLAASEPDPDGAIQPAGTFGQGTQERLGEQEAFPGRGHRSEPQFASLVSPVQHHAPAKGRPFLPIPVEHSEQLLA